MCVSIALLILFFFDEIKKSLPTFSTPLELTALETTPLELAALETTPLELAAC
jgi:hypothetical protein